MTPESDSQKVDLHPYLSVTAEEADRLVAYLNEHYPQLPLEAQLSQFSQDLVKYNRERPNPYHKIEHSITIGPVVDGSKIRKDQESTIMHTLEHGHNVYIRGYWRTGKSTMLRSIQNNLPKSTVNIGNFFGKTSVDVKRELAHEIAHAISSAENHNYEDELALEQEVLRAEDPVEYYNAYLEKKNSMGVLCIDEVVGNLEKPEVMDYIASLGRRRRFSNLRMVFVLHRTNKYEEELMSRFTTGVPFNIGSVPQRDMDTLLRNYNPDQLIQFSPEAKKALIFYGGTSPYTFNILVSTLCEQMGKDFHSYSYKEDKTPALGKLKLTITEDDVKTAAEGVDKGGTSFNLRGHYERILNIALNSNEQEVIYSLSLGPISFNERDKFSPEKQQAFGSLVNFGLAVIDPENELYRINGEILRTIVENTAMREIYKGDDPEKNSFRMRVMAIVDKTHLSPDLLQQTEDILAGISALLERGTIEDEIDRRIARAAMEFIENPTENLSDIMNHTTNIGHVLGGYMMKGADAPFEIDAMHGYLLTLQCINRINFVEAGMKQGSDSSEIQLALIMALDWATILSRGYKDNTLLTAVNELRARLKSL